MSYRWTAALLIGASQLAFAQDDFSLDMEELRAQLTPIRHATLAAEMNGKIDQLTVRAGDRVEKGQLLVKFDCSLESAQLQKAKAQLSGARNSYQGSKRMADLNAIGAVELANSRVEVDKANADVAYLQASVDRCTLKAPYSGSIGDRLAHAQEYVKAGQPLLEIMDDTALELEFIVPSRWLSWLVPGYAFSVAIDDTGKTYPVKLSYTGMKVDPMSHTVKAVARVDGHFDDLLPGMSGRLQLSPPGGDRSSQPQH